MESGQKPRKKTKHYSRLIKKTSVARLKAGEITIGELCLELNIDRHVVRYWCKNEDRWDNVDGSVTLRKHYPDALKRRLVREVEAGGADLEGSLY
jgi:transposase-like protein